MFESASCVSYRDVFPDSNDEPTLAHERLIGCFIALHGPQEFWPPVVRVDGRVATMLRARVPEAPIYEDSYTSSREYEVWPHCEASYAHPEVLTKPVTHSVKQGTKGKLGQRVRAFDGSHISRSAGRGCRVAGAVDNEFLRHVVLEFLSHSSAAKMLIVKFFTDRANLETQA